MNEKKTRTLKVAAYGIGVFIGILIIIGSIVYGFTGNDFHDQIHQKVGTIKLEGVVDYKNSSKNLVMKFSFIDKDLVPYRRFISNNVPINIFMISHDFAEEYHIVPKFNKFTGVFTVDQTIDLLGKNYNLYINVYPKNGEKTLFTYQLVTEKLSYTFIPFMADKGDNDFDGSYRARFYYPQKIVIGRVVEISMKIFEKKSELTKFQSMNGEIAYMWLVSSDGSVFLSPNLAARSKLTWQVNFPKSGLYKAFVKVKLKDSIHVFRNAFSVGDSDLPNTDIPLMKAE